MILARLENFLRYESMHPGFKAAFNFLENISIKDFKEGNNA